MIFKNVILTRHSNLVGWITTPQSNLGRILLDIKRQHPNNTIRYTVSNVRSMGVHTALATVTVKIGKNNKYLVTR